MNLGVEYMTELAALREENVRLKAERDAALTHGPEDMVRALEELTRERDEARAEVANCHCLLQSCHAAVDPEAYPELSEKLSAALECDLPQCQHVAELEAEVARWRNLIGAEMPADYKDWHQNNPSEWPEVAAASLRSRKADADLAWETVAKMEAEVARLEGLLLSVARVIRGRDGLPCWCDDYDARPDHTHSAKCIEARRIRAQREEG